MTTPDPITPGRVTCCCCGQEVSWDGAYWKADRDESPAYCLPSPTGTHRPPRADPERVTLTEGEREIACEIMHDAYEAAALDAGWETQERSRKSWTDVPEANKATMRAAVDALVEHLSDRLREAKADAWDEGRAAERRDWEFTFDITTPDEDRQPFANPYRETP